MTSPSFITVASGLPRSGTSLVMQMLAAGGMPILADGIRASDDDNPAGYYEFEPVKRTRSDPFWAPSTVGKAVKVIYLLLADLPPSFAYRVLFMRRDLNEVVASQQIMLQRRGELGAGLDAAAVTGVFQRQLEKVEAWLEAQPSFSVMFLNYRDVVNSPTLQAQSIREFLGVELDVRAMSDVVDPALYRNRATG